MINLKDRVDAGKQLARKLLHYKESPDTIVLGLARGGVVVAYEISKALHLPLNVLTPKKIGAPHNPEFAIGAVASDGEVWLSETTIRELGISPSWVQAEAAKMTHLARERLVKYRANAPLKNLKGKTVLLVDDGVATGATMLVEIKSLRKQQAGKIVAVSPVAASDAWATISALSDEAISLHVTDNLMSVSQFYQSFPEVTDEALLALLKG